MAWLPNLDPADKVLSIEFFYIYKYIFNCRFHRIIWISGFAKTLEPDSSGPCLDETCLLQGQFSLHLAILSCTIFILTQPGEDFEFETPYCMFMADLDSLKECCSTP